MPSNDSAEFGSIGISESVIWQMEGARKVFEMKRAGMTASLEYGSPEERPLVSMILGLILIGPGSWRLTGYLFEGARFRLAALRYDLTMLFFFGLGLWLIYQSVVRRSFYLRVSKEGITRKLVFPSKGGVSAIYCFLEEAKQRFAFTCDDRLPVAKRF